MAIATPLIATKLYPPRRRADLLERPRLLELLHDRITYKLMLVCAPAGYGKTTLLVDFVQDLDIPVCWFSLDEGDRDPVVFVDYLLASIRRCFPNFEPDFPAGMRGAWDEARLTRLATAIVNEIQHAISDLFIIVLDDYHLVNEIEPINQLLDRILMHLPEHCQIIISSRTEPTLTPRGLAMLTAQRQVAAIGVSHLRFTANEVKALVEQNFSQEISDEAANLLAHEAEGWITGILLTAQQMEHGLLTAMAPGRGSRQRLYDYLTNEVLSRQRQDVQQFLEESSVLAEMSADLCDALCERHDSRELLSYIEQQNLFLVSIPRDGENWYRYHHLFRDLLLDRLGRRDQARFHALHRRAGMLMEARGQWDQALQHYLKGKADGRAAELVMRAHDDIRESGRWQTLGQWLNLLPETLFNTHPQLCWMKGRVLMETGAPEQAVEHYDRALEKLNGHSDRVTTARVLHDKAVALRFQGHLQASLGVLRQLLNAMQSQPKSALYALTLCEAGIVSSRLGDLEQGNQYLRGALAHFEEINALYEQAVVHDALGSNLLESGNLTGARVQFEQALALWESMGRPGTIAVTLNNLGVIHSARGEFPQALQVYERALYEARRNGVLRIEAFALAGIGDVHRDTGHLDKALAAYTESQAVAEQSGDMQLFVYLLDAMGETYRRRGDYFQALELARRAYERAQEYSSTLDLGRSAATLGAISYEQGRLAPALRYLDQACELLQVVRAHKELAVAHLHRAQAYFRALRKQDALAELEQVVDCLLELGYDAFLVPLAARMPDLLATAVEQGVGGALLSGLLTRVKETHQDARAAEPVELSEPEPPLLVYGLGTARVLVGEREITPGDWRSITSRDMFFYLLCLGPATKNELANVFWPDLSPGKLRSTFHITLHRLRRALDPLETVLFEDNRYHFNRRLNYTFDVERFEHLLVQAQATKVTNPTRAIELFSQAADLYSGDFLEDYASPYDEWRVLKATELSNAFLSAVEQWGTLLLQQGEFQAAREAYQRGVDHDPFRESARRGVMRCLVGLGQRNEALRYYRDFAAFIRAELGAPVAPETTQLFDGIRANKPLDDL